MILSVITGYRLIKVWQFVVTLRLFRSQVQSFSHWFRFVITPILSTVITALSVKSFLITTSFFAVITVKRLLPRLLSLFSVITPWSPRDHGSKVFTRDHPLRSRLWSHRYHTYIFTGERKKKKFDWMIWQLLSYMIIETDNSLTVYRPLAALFC